MKSKIGIYCEPGMADEEVVSTLLSSSHFNPVCFDSAEELIRDYSLGYTKGIVFGLHQVNATRIQLIDDIVASIKGTPLTILAQHLGEEDRLTIGGLGNVFALRHPSELSNLNGVFKKMFAAQPVIARLDERHRVNLRVEFMKDDQNGSCVLTDISHSGASGMVAAGTLKRGDFVRLHVPILEYLQDKWVAAQVVWEERVQSYDGTHKKIGLSFAV